MNMSIGMSYKPISYSILRELIAKQAWEIWSEKSPAPPTPIEFYQISEMAIREVQLNVDKMVAEIIKSRLETLLPPD